jgi:hypothetical protein
MRSPSGSRLNARRVSRYAQSFPVVTMAVCAVLFIAVGCSKGQESGAIPIATPSQQAAAAGIPLYSVEARSLHIDAMPETVTAGKPFQLAFTNNETFKTTDNLVVLQLPAGKTAQDVVDDARKKGPGAEDDWDHVGDSGAPLPAGASAVVRMDLKPGNYVASCWQTGKVGGGTGPPHLVLGMIAPFTVR